MEGRERKEGRKDRKNGKELNGKAGIEGTIMSSIMFVYFSFLWLFTNAKFSYFPQCMRICTK